MTSEQISKIIDHKTFKDSPIVAELIETHISWVILTEHFAFKIKKQLKYSFLDFSTLEKRKYYCEQEVLLNQRLARDTYLGVVPIRWNEDLPFIEGASGKIIGYAVKMKRLDKTRQMDSMLKAGKVNKAHLFQLADQLASFHAFTDEVIAAPDIEKMQANFADIAKVELFLSEVVSEKISYKINQIITFSNAFLKAYAKDIQDRYIIGMMVDGHGDLHSGNIFLLNQPVIFDCIEFNERYRQMDVLSELAFLCMDLEFYGYPKLSAYFIERYNINYPVLLTERDRNLFLYFKLYRANIRLKVNALRAMQATEAEVKEKHVALVNDYYNLFISYFRLLQEKETDVMLKNEESTVKI